ncbi:MAG TPA: hypothetical protein VJZ91_03220 [Blastocatellia bacterium]|nr:hypothetical protein [Blastocatellia bacterium]
MEWNRRLAAEVHRLREQVAELTDWLEPPTKDLRFACETLLPILHLVAQQKLVRKPTLTPRQYERRLVRLCDRIAAIISQTYGERGEAATLADDQALLRLRDLLLDFDEMIFVRNAARRKRAVNQKLQKGKDDHDGQRSAASSGSS